jgi:hypothetical protein
MALSPLSIMLISGRLTLSMVASPLGYFVNEACALYYFFGRYSSR